MLKTNKIIFLKLFKFKLFFNNTKNLLNNNQIFNFIKIFKLFLNLKNFGIFIPDTFFIESNWIFSFWKKGFISNFKLMRWYFLDFFFLKKLPCFLINLTNNNIISKEIKKKDFPLINIFKIILHKKNTNKNIGDYFLYNSGFLLNLDLLFFFIKLFHFFKKYKNV